MNALSPVTTATTVAVDAAELKAAVAKLKPIIGRHNAPVLGCVMVDAGGDGVLLTATNLDETLSIRLDGIVTEPGSLLVPLALINKLLSVHNKGTVEFRGPSIPEVNGTIRCKNVTLEFEPLPLNEWPVTNTGPGVPIDLNLAAIAEILPAVSDDESRPVLCTVLVDGGTYVGTNSYILQLVSTGEATGGKFLLPRAAAVIATKYKGNVAATVHERNITIQLDERTTLISRLQEGTFPPYGTLIPANPPHRLEFAELADNLKALRKLDKTKSMRISQQEPGVLALTPVNGDVKGTVTTPGSLTGVESIGFDPKYLLDTVAGTSSNVLLLTDSLKPAIIREPAPECGDGAERIRLIMPVRLAS